jgi:hypothetical protein
MLQATVKLPCLKLTLPTLFKDIRPHLNFEDYLGILLIPFFSTQDFQRANCWV